MSRWLAILLSGCGGPKGQDAPLVDTPIAWHAAAFQDGSVCLDAEGPFGTWSMTPASLPVYRHEVRVEAHERGWPCALSAALFCYESSARERTQIDDSLRSLLYFRGWTLPVWETEPLEGCTPMKCDVPAVDQGWSVVGSEYDEVVRAPYVLDGVTYITATVTYDGRTAENSASIGLAQVSSRLWEVGRAMSIACALARISPGDREGSTPNLGRRQHLALLDLDRSFGTLGVVVDWNDLADLPRDYIGTLDVFRRESGALGWWDCARPR